MTASRPVRITLPPEGLLGATGEAEIEVFDDHVAIRASDVGVTIKLSAINGVRCDAGVCHLYTRHGTFALRGGNDVGHIERDVIARAGALPGVTRALRALGSHRGRPGAEHDAFFAPLLAARRRAERAVDGAVRLAAFEGAAIRRGVESALLELARRRYPEHASARRATEEELIELAEPLLDACDQLTTRASLVRDAQPEVAVAAWRAWTGAVQRTFEIADRAWMRIARALEEPVRERRSTWTRLFSK